MEPFFQYFKFPEPIPISEDEVISVDTTISVYGDGKLKEIRKGVPIPHLEMCKNYTTSGHPKFKPKCRLERRANLKCHSVNLDCEDYEREMEETVLYRAD